MSQDTVVAVRKIRQVLVVVKKTTYELEVLDRKDPQVLKLIAEGHPATLQWQKTHVEHMENLRAVQHALEKRGIVFKCIDRLELTHEQGQYDLVIAFGGDGTFLETSHTVTGVPILGVNSASSTSHGHYCIASSANFEQVLDEILSCARQALPFMRLEVLVNGKRLPELVTNEVFICHPCPAGTSRYFLDIRGAREEHRSSGLMIGPAVGSTGWMRSCGGVVLPAAANQFQYLTRDMCIWPGQDPRLRRGVLDRGDEIRISVVMVNGKIFIDGQHVCYDLSRADEVLVRASLQDLYAFISPDINQRYLQDAA